MDNNYDFENYSFQPMNNSYWQKYNDLLKNMSGEQRIFVSKQESVLAAKQNLMSTFIDYLFEREKNSFINSSDTAKNIADSYIESVKDAADRYVTRNEQLEKENAELKKQLQQLMLDFGEKENGKNKPTAK